MLLDPFKALTAKLVTETGAWVGMKIPRSAVGVKVFSDGPANSEIQAGCEPRLDDQGRLIIQAVGYVNTQDPRRAGITTLSVVKLGGLVKCRIDLGCYPDGNQHGTPPLKDPCVVVKKTVDQFAVSAAYPLNRVGEPLFFHVQREAWGRGARSVTMTPRHQGATWDVVWSGAPMNFSADEIAEGERGDQGPFLDLRGRGIQKFFYDASDGQRLLFRHRGAARFNGEADLYKGLSLAAGLKIYFPDVHEPFEILGHGADEMTRHSDAYPGPAIHQDEVRDWMLASCKVGDLVRLHARFWRLREALKKTMMVIDRTWFADADEIMKKIGIPGGLSPGYGPGDLFEKEAGFLGRVYLDEPVLRALAQSDDARSALGF